MNIFIEKLKENLTLMLYGGLVRPQAGLQPYPPKGLKNPAVPDHFVGKIYPSQINIHGDPREVLAEMERELEGDR